jgi:TetR/AcrR family transcriptional regulator
MPKNPRPRDATISRQAILEAAEQEFAEHGFGGSRIDSIAKKSGYNKSLIFQYFTDKASLYSAVMQRVRERLDQEFLGYFTDKLSPDLNASQARMLIAEATRFFFNQLLMYPNARQLFAWSAAEGWQAYSLRLGHNEPALEFGRGFLQQAQKLGWIRPELSPETLLMLIMTMPQAMISALPRFNQNPQAPHLEDLREQLVLMILNAITPT